MNWGYERRTWKPGAWNLKIGYIGRKILSSDLYENQPMKWGYEIRTWKLGTRKWVRFEERSHRQIFSETSCLSFYSSSTGFTPKSLPRQCFAYVTLWGWYETKMNMRLEIMFHCRIFELACINALQWRGIYASCGWSSGSSITTTTYFLHSQLWQWAKLVLKKFLLVSCGKTSLEIHVFVVAREW